MRGSLGVAAQSHRRDIQGLRAVAVLAVIAFHAGLPFPGGFTGVDMFFVISGFVITGLLLRERVRSTFTFIGFYARRAKRLLPALAVMTAIVILLSLFFESPIAEQETTGRTAIGAMLLVANYVIIRAGGSYFDPVAETNPLLHTWSLSVEEQFYLVFPALLVVLLLWGARRGQPRAIAFAAIAAVSIASFGVSLALSFEVLPISFTAQESVWAFYAGPTRVWEFGLGALLCLALARPTRPGSRSVATSTAVLGVGLLGLSVFWVSDTLPFPGFAALLPVFGVVLVIYAGSVAGNPIQRGLASRPMVVIGDASYSLYLWHWPLIVFASLLWPGPWTAPLAAALAFIPAWLSYRFVETPCRRAVLQSAPRTLILNGVASLAVIGLALGALALGPRVTPFATDANFPTMTSQRDCLLFAEAFKESDIERCTFGVPGARGWVLFAGDSHADSYANAVIESANALDYDVIAILGGRCPLIRDARAFGDISNCSEMNAALFGLVHGANPPDLVVLAQSDLPPQTFESVAEITQAGIPIVFLRDFPRWRASDDFRGPNPCRGGIVNFECVQPREVVAAFSQGLRERETELLTTFTNLTSFDPWSYICTDVECSPIINGRLGYLDDDHLNEWGSRQLQYPVATALREALGL